MSRKLFMPSASEWRYQEIADCCSLVSRGTSPHYVETSNIKAIGQRCVRSRFDPASARPHSEHHMENVLIAQAGDILLNSTGTGTIGRSCIFPGGGTFIVDSHVTVLRPSSKIDPHWLNYLLQTDYFQRHLELYCYTGSTNQIELARNSLAQTRIPVPVLREQQRIAEILDTIDTAIQHTEALIAKLKAAKAGLLHDLLTRGLDENGQLRDPERNPELFKNTTLGLVPVTWEVVTINDIAVHVGSGTTPRGGSNVYRDEGVLFIRSQNVSFDGLKLADVAFITPAIHSKMFRSQVLPYDVLLNITGASIGRCTWAPVNIGLANVNQHVCIIRLPQANKANAIFLSAVLSSPIGQSQIERLNAGGNREGLNYQQLRNFVIPWPSGQERAQIARAIELHEERVRTEEAQLSKLHQLKRGLMEDLLTGRVRVPLAQPEAAQAEAVN